MSTSKPSFDEFMGKADELTGHVRRIQQRAINPRHRLVLGRLLEEIAKAREEVLATVPAAMVALKDKAQSLHTQAQQQIDRQGELRAQGESTIAKARAAAQRRQQAKKAIRERVSKLPKVQPKVSLPKVSPEQLHDELLQRFGRLPASGGPDVREGEIWEDWK